MWVLALVLAAAPPLPVISRADGGPAAPVAQVVLVQGAVQVKAPKVGTAQVGVLLGAEDVLNVPPDAWVVLALLGNGHAVRLDDDLTVTVGALGMLKATTTLRPLEAQLNALVSPEERQGSQRLAGWHAGQTAANVPSARGAVAPPAAPPPAAPPPPPPPPPSPRVKASALATDDAKAASVAPAPASALALLDRDEAISAQQQCAAALVGALGPDVKALVGASLDGERKQLADGRWRFRLEQSLPMSGCLQQVLQERAVSRRGAWERFSIPLP